MHLFNYCKQLLLTSCLALLSLHATATQYHNEELRANKIINQLYHSLNGKPNLDLSTRITIISAQFLGKPYVLGALGESIEGKYDQSPLYRADAFDCETYVDTVIALALAQDLDEFKRRINQVRYRDGHVSYIDRNHFTCLDWNQNNQRQGLVKDITTTLRDEHHQMVAKYARGLIDKPAWYNHKSIDTIRLNTRDSGEHAKRLESLKRKGSQLPRSTSIIPYIPLTALFDSTGKANQYLFNQIPNAAIIEIIRPNWDLSQNIGTHLNVSHLGFVILKKGRLQFREASSTKGRVVDVPLIDYLQNARKSPTIKGINIQVVLPPS